MMFAEAEYNSGRDENRGAL